MDQVTLYLDTARAYTRLVALVRPEDWQRPALGVWDVRALVGHTTRALTTVVDYLAVPEPEEGADVLTAPEYFAAFAASPDKAAADDAVAARGHAAGVELGHDPAARTVELTGEVARALDGLPVQRLVATRFGHLRLEEYLRTRTFELVVHGLDLTRALDLPGVLPSPAVAGALELATQTAVASGHGPQVLAALTGRAPLPPGFGVL
ncbi:maleylpyruvate isomerase N-terminal domain-containing protein [Oceanitalea stevensii]|uniref:Maleylpyruvate isomerase N-terminal domain-containing protein n=1 Tax=Oceanitalea stevensii TaxID=2763072 RepID=A0ABR8YYU3_9MICO|nr:maleylpyruvate isomerase N-terminal domain-containing protein [Oceanitalea stevensii]MBD8061220.1 maleylpyruvate isomerase N-terminal domain-containing protein [Oceanitalea stevensii]